MNDASRAALAAIGARIVDLSGLELVRGHRDRLFGAHAAALVRPDRYVFGVTDDAHSLDDLIADLTTKLNGDQSSPLASTDEREHPSASSLVRTLTGEPR